jgi:hypothetical protein
MPADRRHLAAGLVALLALVSCGGGGDDAEAEEPLVPETTTTAPADDAEDAILDGYRAGWEAFQEAMDPPDPDDPALAETSTGVALDQSRRYLGEIRGRGNVLRGGMVLDPEVREQDDATAVVWDCVEDTTTELPPDSPEQGGTAVPVGWEVHLELVDGTWVHAARYDTEAACAS